MIHPLKIGDLTIDPPLLLAPMAGYTKAPFRTICRKHHCSLVFTEVVSAEGIARRSRVSMRYLESFPEERPIGAHIYGGNIESLARAAQIIESLGRFDLIDINCGCPVPKIMNRGAGAALMQDPEKIRQIVQAVSQAVSLPVTVKTRLGLSKELYNVSEIAHAVEEGGADALCIHARFAADKHKGPADLDALKRVKAERSIPVIGNGGVKEAHHASDMMQRTGVDGVMVARAAIGNPWIFEEIHCLWAGEIYAPPMNKERRDVIAEHLNRLHQIITIENQGHKLRSTTNEQIACGRFRGHLVKYLAGMRGFRHLQRNLMQMNSIEAVMEGVDQVLKANPHDQPAREIENNDPNRKR